ncbi:MAG TPA: arylamine N-acetyltransferase [Herpetosiphonaceae bacterium]
MTEQTIAGFDLDAYCERIGYAGERAATPAALAGIVARQAAAIPFENLNPLLGLPVALDLAAVAEKLVAQGRGGYCFEHNRLLWAALEALGFAVSGLAARVVWNAPEGAVTPRGHMLLRVDLGGQTLIADTGFGGLTLTAPLALEPGIEQPTPHEPFRLEAAEAGYVLQAQVGGAWKPLYAFDLQRQHPVDYIAANWYLSTHPQSHFVTGLMAARPDDGRRHALRNNQLTTHYVNGDQARSVLGSAGELRQALEDVFLIRLPDAPGLGQALERIAAGDPLAGAA